jgi:hypothetical protein
MGRYHLEEGEKRAADGCAELGLERVEGLGDVWVERGHGWCPFHWIPRTLEGGHDISCVIVAGAHGRGDDPGIVPLAATGLSTNGASKHRPPRLMEALAGFVVAGLLVFAVIRHVAENLTKNCPRCGQRVKERALLCPYCAHRFFDKRLG